MLQLAGFEAMVYEGRYLNQAFATALFNSSTDFYEIFVSIIQQVITPDSCDGNTLNTSILLEAFQDPQSMLLMILILPCCVY